MGSSLQLMSKLLRAIRLTFAHARLVGVPPMDFDPHGLQAAYDKTMEAGDYPAVSAVLADRRLNGVVGLGYVIRDPIPLHRAMVAFLIGDHAAAQASADEAITNYQGKLGTSFQQPFVLLGVARAAAYAGRPVPALRDAQAALDRVVSRDGPSTMTMRFEEILKSAKPL